MRKGTRQEGKLLEGGEKRDKRRNTGRDKEVNA
jgi:hypothetical protein